MAPGTVHTVGHSTRSAEEFVALLREVGVQELVDIRTVPRSRTSPRFDLDRPPTPLAAAGVGHTDCKGLGGLRPTSEASVNTAWGNASFRGYADHLQIEEFRAALAGLEQTPATLRDLTVVDGDRITDPGTPPDTHLDTHPDAHPGTHPGGERCST